MSPHELQILESLDAILRVDAIHAVIESIVPEVEQKLMQDSTAQMAWLPIPLSVYGHALPAGILSSWVFILRAGAPTGAEKHPNSHQRMMSYGGCGDLQTLIDGEWRSNKLVSDPQAPLLKRWASVPADVWHQAAVPNQNWVVVSFHTVPAQELIEERPELGNSEHLVRKTYLSNRADKRETTT